MPLARIDLAEGKTADYRRAIGEVVYDAQVEVLKAPKDDRFQVITEHPAQDFIFDPSYLGIQRSKDCVFIQVTLNTGRTVDQKRAFYKAIADGLHERLSLRQDAVDSEQLTRRRSLRRSIVSRCSSAVSCELTLGVFRIQ